MYNLNADDISMVDGGGDGGYPASSSAMKNQAKRATSFHRDNLGQIALGAAGVAVTCNPAGLATGAGALACISAAYAVANGISKVSCGR
ncbi:hypothetical protein ACPV54_19005 [Vibrio mediterranei]